MKQMKNKRLEAGNTAHIRTRNQFLARYTHQELDIPERFLLYQYFIKIIQMAVLLAIPKWYLICYKEQWINNQVMDALSRYLASSHVEFIGEIVNALAFEHRC